MNDVFAAGCLVLVLYALFATYKWLDWKWAAGQLESTIDHSCGQRDIHFYALLDAENRARDLEAELNRVRAQTAMSPMTPIP